MGHKPDPAFQRIQEGGTNDVIPHRQCSGVYAEY